MRNVSLEPSNRKFFKIKKFESLAFQELVNQSCLGEGECPHLYRNHEIKPQMITITLNALENIAKKFHNDQGKTLGDMSIYFRGDLLLLHCLVVYSCVVVFR